MDNVVTVHHGGSVEEDEFGNISFVGMHRVSLIFNDRPLFSELFRRARDELHCNSNEDTISVEGVLHYGYGKSGRIFRRLLPIACQGDWEKYVKTVMKNEFQCLDLLVRKLSTDRIPHVYSPPNGHSPHRGFSPAHENLAPYDPSLRNREGNMEDVVIVPDAQSASNEVGICPDVGAECRTDDVITTPKEIPLTQNHPRDIANYVGVPPMSPSSNIGWASNSVDVEIADEEEPYGTARAVDSDDDRPVPPLSEEDMEFIRLFLSRS